ncbi:MAG: cupin domain-containing protein [Bacteroidales bacterium]|nr:cupin domain-containing protein [Bacteroidales bacterium]
MIIKSVKDLQVEENPHRVDVRQMYNHDNAQAMHMTLLPGQSLKPHITPVDVFFYVLEGNPTIQVDDEIITVEKDNLVESPKDIVHCISNKSNSPARILVVKAPKQIGKAILL